MTEYDPSAFGVHLSKQYHREHFGPSDFQWSVTKIDDDFTLYDVFKLVALAERVTPGIAKTLGMSNFDLFWAQINKDRDPNYKILPTYLELYWISECVVKEDTCEEDPTKSELPGLMSFHGVGPGCVSMRYEPEHKCHKDCLKDQGYGIEFTPVNNLAHLPIRVLPNVQFNPPFSQNKKSFRHTEFSLRIDPTLWCLITSIFWELTFVDSTPDKISDNYKQIFGMIKGIRKRLEKADENIDFLEDVQ